MNSTGWGLPWDCKEFHYFIDHWSMCGRMKVYSFKASPNERQPDQDFLEKHSLRLCPRCIERLERGHHAQ